MSEVSWLRIPRISSFVEASETTVIPIFLAMDEADDHCCNLKGCRNEISIRGQHSKKKKKKKKGSLCPAI
jgi:hypothetical protein